MSGSTLASWGALPLPLYERKATYPGIHQVFFAALASGCHWSLRFTWWLLSRFHCGTYCPTSLTLHVLCVLSGAAGADASFRRMAHSRQAALAQLANLPPADATRATQRLMARVSDESEDK